MAEGRRLSDNSALDDDLAFRLRLAYMAVMRRFEAALKPFELRPSLYAAMVLIEAAPGRKQHEVGEALGVAASNLAVLMDQLETRGYLSRERVAGDTRSYAVTLTAAGAAALAAIKVEHAKAAAEIDAVVGKHRAQLLEALGDLAGMG